MYQQVEKDLLQLSLGTEYKERLAADEVAHPDSGCFPIAFAKLEQGAQQARHVALRQHRNEQQRPRRAVLAGDGEWTPLYIRNHQQRAVMEARHSARLRALWR